MNPRKKTTAGKKKTVIKKDLSISKTKSIVSKQGLKKKLNEFGDADSF